MAQDLHGEWKARDVKIALVVSRFNDYLTDHMATAAVNAYRRCGGDPEAPGMLTIAHVPGSLELAVTARKFAESRRYDAVVCLGVVIRGQTDHYDHVVDQTAKGIREVNTQTGVPCIFGVITADNLEQALNRAGAKMGNQGEKAMLAGIEMANLMKNIATEQE